MHVAERCGALMRWTDFALRPDWSSRFSIACVEGLELRRFATWKFDDDRNEARTVSDGPRLAETHSVRAL